MVNKQNVNIRSTFQEFLSFILAQPKERAIDHSGGWQACAIGDFNESVGMRRNDLSITSIIHLHHKDLYQILNCNGRVYDWGAHKYGPCLINNYGELQAYITQHCQSLLGQHNVEAV